MDFSSSPHLFAAATADRVVSASASVDHLPTSAAVAVCASIIAATGHCHLLSLRIGETCSCTAAAAVLLDPGCVQRSVVNSARNEVITFKRSSSGAVLLLRSITRSMDSPSTAGSLRVCLLVVPRRPAGTIVLSSCTPSKRPLPSCVNIYASNCWPRHKQSRTSFAAQWNDTVSH